MTQVEPTSDWPPPVDQGGFDDTVPASAGVAVPPQPGRVQVLKRRWPMARLTPYGAAGTSTSNSPSCATYPIACGARRVGSLRCRRVFVDQSADDPAPPDIVSGQVGDVRTWLGWPLAQRAMRPVFVVVRIEVDHVTVYRWVQRFTPLLADAAPFSRHSPGDRWFAG
jgi:hypothetical protein